MRIAYIVLRKTQIENYKFGEFHLFCIFVTKKSAKKWIEQWKNADDFRIERLELNTIAPTQ